MTTGLKMVISDDEREIELPEEAVNEILNKTIFVKEMVHDIEQTPPMFSKKRSDSRLGAKKVKFPTDLDANMVNIRCRI